MGVTFLNNKPVDFQVHLDASLSELKGVFGPLVYALPLGIQFQHLHMKQLEILNIVVALKIWCQLWENKKVQICCDNQAVVEVLKTDKTKYHSWPLVTEMFGL